MSERTYYAAVRWSPYDVQTLRPSWSVERCEEWLQENQKYVAERLVELGWDVLEALLDPEDETADSDDPDRSEEATSEVLCQKLLLGESVSLSDTSGNTPILERNEGALTVGANQDGEYHGEFVTTEVAFSYRKRGGTVQQVTMGELMEAQPMGSNGFLLPNGNELWVHPKVIMATFIPQAWQNDYAVEVDGRREVDVTTKVLQLPLESIRKMTDDQEQSDWLIEVDKMGEDGRGHHGPFRVEVSYAIEKFFGVEELSDITPEMLANMRQQFGGAGS